MNPDNQTPSSDNHNLTPEPPVTPPAPTSPTAPVSEPIPSEPQPVVFDASSGAAPESASPVPAQPVTPLGQANAMNAPLGMRGTGKSSKKTWLKASLALIVLLVLIGVVAVLAFGNKSISPKDVANAQSALTAVNNDSASVVSTFNNVMNNGEFTSAAFNSAINKASTKLSNAQAQFNVLKNSNTLSNAGVKTAFNAFSNKWTPYYNYLAGELSDAKGYYPPLIQLGNNISTITSGQTSSPAQETALISNLKATTDSALTTYGSLKEANPQDQKLITDMTTLLNSTDQQLAAAAKDQAAGNAKGVVNDMQVLTTQLVGFATNLQNDLTAINNKVSELSPGSTYDHLRTAINQSID